MTISPLSGLSQPNGITGTLTGLSNAGGLSSQSSSGPAPTYANVFGSGKVTSSMIIREYAP